MQSQAYQADERAATPVRGVPARWNRAGTAPMLCEPCYDRGRESVGSVVAGDGLPGWLLALCPVCAQLAAGSILDGLIAVDRVRATAVIRQAIEDLGVDAATGEER